MPHCPEPGTKEYDEMVDFMRADLESDMGLTKLIEGARKMFESEGRDFDKEFAEYLAAQHECTYMDEDDIQVFVCNNCGAHHESVKDIPHHTTCKKGEAKRWEKFYSENNDEGPM